MNMILSVSFHCNTIDINRLSQAPAFERGGPGTQWRSGMVWNLSDEASDWHTRDLGKSQSSSKKLSQRKLTGAFYAGNFREWSIITMNFIIPATHPFTHPATLRKTHTPHLASTHRPDGPRNSSRCTRPWVEKLQWFWVVTNTPSLRRRGRARGNAHNPSWFQWWWLEPWAMDYEWITLWLCQNSYWKWQFIEKLGMECHHPNWRTNSIILSEGLYIHQAASILCSFTSIIIFPPNVEHLKTMV